MLITRRESIFKFFFFFTFTVTSLCAGEGYFSVILAAILTLISQASIKSATQHSEKQHKMRGYLIWHCIGTLWFPLSAGINNEAGCV